MSEDDGISASSDSVAAASFESHTATCLSTVSTLLFILPGVDGMNHEYAALKRKVL